MREPRLRRISDPKTVDIRHHVFPWQDGQPVLARMQGTRDLFLLLFSSMQLLNETMTEMDIPFEAIKQVDDPLGFIGSLPRLYAGSRLRVIVDPHMTSDATMKYAEIIRETIN